MSEVLSVVATAVADKPEINRWFVVGMGIGTVFVGLIFIVIFCSILGAIMRKKKDETPVSSAPVASAAPVENRGEIIAAVCAAAAEEMGTDVSALRVVSFKKL